MRGRGNPKTQPLCLVHPFHNSLLSILNRFGGSIAIRHTSWKIRDPRKIAASLTC
jgi:hypothetical protein